MAFNDELVEVAGFGGLESVQRQVIDDEQFDAGFHSRFCRRSLGVAQMVRGDLAAAIAQIREVAAEADAAHDVLLYVYGKYSLGRGGVSR